MAETLILQKKRAQCTFRETEGGAVYDPAEITLRVGRVTGSTVTNVLTKAKADLTRVETGIYYFDFIPEEAGQYFIRFTTDDGVDVETPVFFVSAGNTPLS